jgi:hypothetical protein
MPNVFSYPPSGLDRATGVGGMPGTATPNAAIIARGSGGAITLNDIQLEELPSSPTFERAEQATIRHQFRLPLVRAFQLQVTLGRGTFLIDSYGNQTRVLSSEVTPEKPDMAVLTITSEGINFDTPPDEFSIVPEQLGVWIVKHPRYWYSLDGFWDIIFVINQFDESQNLNEKAGAKEAIASLPVPSGKTQQQTDLAKAAAFEIIDKLATKIDSPYLPGFRVTWSQYYWAPVALSPGAFIQDPILEGGLPEFFWSTDFTGDISQSIFSRMGAANPQCYLTPTGELNISWLRQADEMEYVRTWFKVTRTWIGSPIGNWDPLIYQARVRPTTPQEYQVTYP